MISSRESPRRLLRDSNERSGPIQTNEKAVLNGRDLVRVDLEQSMVLMERRQKGANEVAN